MSRARISFPAFSFRRVETPFDKHPGYKNYVAVVEVNDLPDLSDWRKINIRDPKLTGELPRAIRDSFLSNKETFVFLNRGIVLAVDSAEFDNSKGQLHLTMVNPNLHGLLDGGHTYEVIKQNRKQFSENSEKQYVKVEVIEGFDAKELVNLVDARNSSNQVKDESLMNLANEFKKIKDVFEGESYANKIAYKEYETSEDGEPKPISIREIISFLMTMDAVNFNSSVHPINAYRSKAACLSHFSEHKKDFDKIYPIAADIVRLWDTIHVELPEMYNKVRGERGG
jgi:AIPR protein